MTTNKYLIVPTKSPSFLRPYFTDKLGDAELDSQQMGLCHIFDVANDKRMVYPIVWEDVRAFVGLPELTSRPEHVEL